MKLLLLEHVPREAIGPRGSLIFRPGEPVDFAMGLLQGLLNLLRLEPVAPRSDSGGIAADRMPQSHGGTRAFCGYGLQIDIHELAIAPNACSRLIPLPQFPDQPPRQRADQRMVEVAFTPDVDRPCRTRGTLHKQTVDAVALCGQHLLDFSGGCFQFFQLLRIGGLDDDGHATPRLTFRVDPG